MITEYIAAFKKLLVIERQLPCILQDLCETITLIDETSCLPDQ